MLKVPKRYIVVFILIMTIVLIRIFLYTTYTTVGDSMKPAFNDGDRVIIKKRVSDFSNNDVVIFKKNEAKYIKRIAGVPTQKIKYNEESEDFFIDGQEIDNCCEQYKYSIHDLFREKPMTIPKGYYFVLGDNANDSIDSRNFGLVAEEEIIGKVTIKYWPIFTKSTD